MKITEHQIRSLIKKVVIEESLTKSDKSEIERMIRRYMKSALPKETTSAVEKEVKKRNGAVEKKISDAITDRFKKANTDKDFDEAVIRVAKRVLKGLHDMHYKRTNLIDQMPIPKN